MNQPLVPHVEEPAPDARTGAGGVAIHQTATFAYSTAEEMADVFRGRAPGHVYTRISNPTTLALERRLTELERGIGCVATSSGMAALASVMVGLRVSPDRGSPPPSSPPQAAPRTASATTRITTAGRGNLS